MMPLSGGNVMTTGEGVCLGILAFIVIGFFLAIALCPSERDMSMERLTAMMRIEESIKNRQETVFIQLSDEVIELAITYK
jgi:hypothetical protein